MEITILGTSSMVPTKERNVTAVFLKYGSEGLLFDCGEGTQRQMNITGLNRNKIRRIFISHWHGDHVSGLIGLLQTMGNIEYSPKVDIYGPKGTKEYMNHLIKAIVFDVRVNLKIHEIDAPKGKITPICETPKYMVKCAPLSHGIECLGYSFIEKDRRRINKSFLEKHNIPEGPHLAFLQEGRVITYKGKRLDPEEATKMVKGKKFVFITDTEPATECELLAKDADLLVMEATYSSEHEHKAREYKHMTSTEAAMIANNANVKKLLMTHFSQRYENCQILEEEAQIVFDKSYCAEDFMKVRL